MDLDMDMKSRKLGCILAAATADAAGTLFVDCMILSL